MRHAEKPLLGRGLSARGAARAAAYAAYFDPFHAGGATLTPSRLIATRETAASDRPALTLEPLAERLGLPIDVQWPDRDVRPLVAALRADNAAPVVLIAWHHGRIPALIKAFGGSPKDILGRAKWPGKVYDWVVVLRFDGAGQLRAESSRLVDEPTFAARAPRGERAGAP